MTQHKRELGDRVVHRYDADTLGAPFKVTLIRSVTEQIDAETGERIIKIPDLNGLIDAVVHCRVCDEMKLNGDELKCIRRALDVKANKIADLLGISAEHLSRCEAGAKTLSQASEKIFRAFAFMAAASGDARNFLDSVLGEVVKPTEENKSSALELAKFFFTMKIMPMFDAEEELHYEFRRCCPPEHDCTDETRDGKWAEMSQKKAA